MKYINTVVKYNKQLNCLELFYLDQRNDLVCFCFKEGHNLACKEYMYSLDHVSEEAAKAFIHSYNNNADFGLEFIYSKRLQRWGK